MALKILFGDPDEAWLGQASDFFTNLQYEVDTVNNGKEVQLSLYKEKYFCVVINEDIQNHSGMQVLKFIKSNCTNQRVIVVSAKSEAELNEAMDNYKKLGVTEVVKGPIQMQDLQDVLEGHQSLGDLMSGLAKRDGVSAEEEVQASDSDYTKVRIDEFYSAKSVLFDIFIRLKENKYVKILHSGDTFSKERIDKYKNEKKVEFLYFHNSDRRKYIHYYNFLTAKIVENKNVPTKVKETMLKNVSIKFIEEAYTVGLKPQVIEQGKEVCENVYKMIESEPALHVILRSMEDFDPSLYSHCYLTTLFAGAIIKQFDWQSKTTIESTAMACMFHDIGKMKLPPEILKKNISEMSDYELSEYKKHPILGIEIVDKNRLISNAVKQIILQHHEYYDGTGYPRGCRGSKILTLANIVCLASDFANIISQQKISPVEALKNLLTDESQVMRYNSLIVENFIKAFADPKKLKKERESKMMVSKKVS